MMRWILQCLLSVTVLFSLTGCGKRGGESSAGGESLRLAFLTNNAASFWVIARRGTEAARAECGDLTVDFRMPGGGTAAEQQQILDDLLAKGVDGIAISPVDPANQLALLNRVAAQTLLITQDSDAPESDRVCYIGTDNVAAGRAAGALIREAIPEGGRIMVFVGKIDAQNAKERHQGIVEALEGSPIEIIDVRTDDVDQVRARTNVEDTLVKYPDVACLVGLWAYNGPAILNAVREAGKLGQVKIVCFDEEEETLAGVAAGHIHGTVVQQPYEFGRLAITRMAQYLRGDPKAFPDSGVLVVPTLDVKKDNVAAFKARLEELLGG